MKLEINELNVLGLDASWKYYIEKISKYKFCNILNEDIMGPSTGFYLILASNEYHPIFEVFCNGK